MEQCVSDRNQTSKSWPETLSSGGYRMLAVILGVSSVAGVVLNLLVITITVRHRQLRQPLSYALVNLAVCDLGCALFGGLPSTVSSAMGHFHLGRIGCTLEGFAVAFFGIASLCTVAVISVERYIVVCNPVGGVQFQTRHAVGGLLLSWLWSFLWNTPPLFGWGSYDIEGVKISCAPKWQSRDSGDVSYIVMYFVFCFAVPFSIILVSYWRLLWTLRQVSRLQLSQARSTYRLEVHVARMVVVMVLAFLLTWLPYATMALSVTVDSSLHLHPVVATVPVVLAKSSTVYNPIIYIFMNRQFQRLAVQMVCCGWNPWALSDLHTSEVESTVPSLTRAQRSSPKGSLK